MSAILGAMIGPLVTYLLSILGLAIVAVHAIFRLNSTQIIREKGTEATSARRARRYSIDIRSFDRQAMPGAIVRNSRKLLPKKASTEAVDYRADVGVKDGGLA
ncbi:hypothetical protein EOS_32560 [Caballeronia mineralivorans PML1(12)]|uniref:Uncharacterized protein n=1 Tax=Caballeronia mineralivorans PML1(12) TaxID=908627 RepID=A0A0J1CMQ7_9BURK|nr:hypothetical protein [Caballeronia mineralivorans]KLU22045.1 hypothetical protein EOS_32560 [Caballeronia mineralivorans PML1(12)]